MPIGGEYGFSREEGQSTIATVLYLVMVYYKFGDRYT